MLLNEYETVVLIKPDVGDEPLNKLAQRLKTIIDGDGKFLALNNWGKKKLAYEIEKNQKAIYLHVSYLGQAALPKELERNLGISDDVMRYMTVSLAENIDPVSRESKELETLKIVAEAEEEDLFVSRREDVDAEFGGDDFDGGFDEETT